MSSNDWTGRVVWITGGGSGIGQATAVEFARRGATVAVSGRRSDALQETVEQIKAVGGKAHAVACDVCDAASVEEARRQIVAEHGRLDVLVCNAGFGIVGAIPQLTMDDWRRQFDTNVFGVLHCIYAGLPELRKTGGRIALIGSISAYINMPRFGAYSASKHAVRAIGETLWLELQGTGVSCTTVHPGYVESNIARVNRDGHFDPSRRETRPPWLMWKAARAGRVIVDAIGKRRRELIFTWHGRAVVWDVRWFPGIFYWILGKLAARKLV